jgi:hypothetical protein
MARGLYPGTNETVQWKFLFTCIFCLYLGTLFVFIGVQTCTGAGTVAWHSFVMKRVFTVSYILLK